MKKYRLAYDNLFLPNNLKNGIHYKGENISALNIYMVYKVIDKNTGEEIYFQDDDWIEQKLEYMDNEYCYVDNFYKCVLDKKEIFKMIPNKELFKRSRYIVFYEVGDCIKWLKPNNDPVLIKYEEFIDILKNNLLEFDNSNNNPTQSTAYYIVNINE